MGVTDFNKLFKEKAPSAYRSFSANTLNGHRLAIDGHNWMYSRLAAIQNNNLTEHAILTGELDRGKLIVEWLDACLNFNVTLLSYGITPLWVFDGDHPVEKKNTKKKRMNKKKDASAKLQEYRSVVGEMQGVEQLNITAETIQQMKKLMGQDTRIYGDEQEILRSTLEGIGLPCFRAYGEAEQLCAMFCLDGLASAVFSTDTDNLVYGAPLMITGFSKHPIWDPTINGKVHTFDCVHLPTLLTEARLPFEAFRELCITLGCDYNNNIPGVGIKRAHDEFRKMLDNYGMAKIEGLAYKWNIDSLERHACRWLFMYRPYRSVISNTTMLDEPGTIPNDQDLEESLFIKDVLATQGRDILEPVGLERWLAKLAQVLPTVPRPSRVEPDPIAAQVKAIVAPDPKTLEQPAPTPIKILRLKIVQPGG